MDQIVALDGFARRHKDSLGRVPRHGVHRRAEFFLRIGRMPGHRRTETIAVEAVVGDEQHRRLRARHGQQAAQHHVQEAVDPAHHVAVDRRILLADVAHGRRMVFHEAVPRMIDGVEVNGQEIPVVTRGETNRCVLHGRGFREQTREQARPGVGRVGRKPFREKRAQLFERNFAQPDQETPRILKKFGGVN